MLEVKNLCFQPQGERQILKNINLTVPDGKLIVFTGPNGGGKTTLAKILAGIENPTSGEILLDGENITSLDPTQRAKKGISYAFQQPVRFKGFSIRDLLDIANQTALTDREFEEVLGQVGLDYDSYKNRHLDSKLSGGEIKRIEIASVLLRKTKLAIFDEPEAGIDLWSFNSLIRVFEKMRDERKCTLLIISHQERILSIADEIVMIQDGKIGLSGPTSKMFPLICNKSCSSCEGCSAEGGVGHGRK